MTRREDNTADEALGHAVMDSSVPITHKESPNAPINRHSADASADRSRFRPTTVHGPCTCFRRRRHQSWRPGRDGKRKAVVQRQPGINGHETAERPCIGSGGISTMYVLAHWRSRRVKHPV